MEGKLGETVSQEEKLFGLGDMEDVPLPDDPGELRVMLMGRECPAESEDDEAEGIDLLARAQRIGTAITLLCCAVGTVVALILFSTPDFHENTDAFFKGLIDFLVEYFNTGWGGLLLIAGALAVPLLAILVLPLWDMLMTRIPLGDFLENHVGLCFDRHPGLRFLPAFITAIYFLIASFMGDADFNPESYNPFAQQYSAGEWVNFVYMVLVVFSLLLVIAESAVSAGFWGMLLHIPVILAANIYIAVIVAELMFVATALLGFIGQIVAVVVCLPIFLIVMLFAGLKK